MSPNALSTHSTKAWEADKPEMPTMLGRYRVLGTIGKGGMGIVFKGFHLNLERDVAIKTMRIDKISTPDIVTRFRREIKLIGQMDHDNVVRATDAGERNGIFFLVMEFLTGLDLNKLVAHHGPLDLADACELTRQAALGLDYIHQTLIHRDIKPSNLMLTTAGQVKILDLGLAHCEQDGSNDHDQTPAGMVLGTRFYMAPEQARGSSTIDGRADIYSLGCTLFKLVTGKEPYSGPEYGTSASQIYAHCHVQLPSVPAFELIPEELRPILLRMVAKNPDERYRSGRAVAEALAPFAVGSAPAALGAAGRGEPRVQPLMQPLPEELSRLTQSVVETPRDTPTVSTVALAPPPRKVRWLLVACVLVGILGVVSWLYGPALFIAAPDRKLKPPDPAPSLGDVPTSLRNLDKLAARQYYPLLDQTPFTLDGALDDPHFSRWDKGAQLLQMIASRKQLFFLGKTSRSRFSFEVAINQAPWTGNIGIFWGYHEDEKIKKDETYKKDGVPGPYFASFQMVKLHHEVGPRQEDLYFVTRHKGRLRWNKQGELAIEQDGTAWPAHPVPLKRVATILQIEIDGSKVRSARLGPVELDTLYSPVESERCQGALGVISITHGGTFTNARFIIHSNN